jgi:hypothetical protein
MPLPGQDGMAELLKIAARFEEEICFEATDEVIIKKNALSSCSTFFSLFHL